MRSVVVGLALAVGLVAGAQAKGCRLDGATLVASEFNRPSDPALIGQTFKVQRIASALRTMPDTVGSLGSVTGGELTMEVQGKSGRYVVSNSFAPHSAPWSSGSSKLTADAAIKWGARSRSREAIVLGEHPSFDMYGGPLKGLTLTPQHCM